MQAHQKPTHHRIVSLLALTLCSLTLWGTGCDSSESTEYREFSEQTDSQTPATEQQADSGQESVAASDPQQPAQEPEPEIITQTAAVKPAPTEPAESKSPTDATSATTDENDLPLVAQRPDPAKRALTKAEAEQVAASQEPREVKILVKNKSFRHVSPGNVLQVSYDDIDLLKVMNMEPVTPKAPELMPQWLKDLDGKRIRIRGFMYPPFQQTGNEYFLLARDNQICCFGKNPKIYDLFPVILKEGVTTDYILNRPFDVVGVFHIKAETLDGEMERLYMIDDAIVIDK